MLRVSGSVSGRFAQQLFRDHARAFELCPAPWSYRLGASKSCLPGKPSGTGQWWYVYNRLAGKLLHDVKGHRKLALQRQNPSPAPGHQAAGSTSAGKKKFAFSAALRSPFHQTARILSMHAPKDCGAAAIARSSILSAASKFRRASN